MKMAIRGFQPEKGYVGNTIKNTAFNVCNQQKVIAIKHAS